MIDPTWVPRKLTHAQVRLEQLDVASRMSLPERLAGRLLDLADAEQLSLIP